MCCTTKPHLQYELQFWWLRRKHFQMIHSESLIINRFVAIVANKWDNFQFFVGKWRHRLFGNFGNDLATLLCAVYFSAEQTHCSCTSVLIYFLAFNCLRNWTQIWSMTKEQWSMVCCAIYCAVVGPYDCATTACRFPFYFPFKPQCHFAFSAFLFYSVLHFLLWLNTKQKGQLERVCGALEFQQ